jgi:hypothetical protein
LLLCDAALPSGGAEYFRPSVATIPKVNDENNRNILMRTKEK